MTDQPEVDPLKDLDFPTHVACMGAVHAADDKFKQCETEATRVVVLKHRRSEDGEPCGTNRYPVCDPHALVFVATGYRQFYSNQNTEWRCTQCGVTIHDPDEVISVVPLFEKETP